MRRKSKEELINKDIVDSKKTSETKPSTVKDKTGVKKETTKKVASKKTTSNKDASTSKKSTKVTSKASKSKVSTSVSSKKASSNSKSSTSKKSTSRKTNAKAKSSSIEKKVTTSSRVNKKASTSKSTKNKKQKLSNKPKKLASVTLRKMIYKKDYPFILEYYDLPYRYNQTVVKLLYQTPTTLFIYWDISVKDSEKLKEKYGEDFFEKTRPVLIVHNETKGYSFEVEINDFANCWYLNVKDSKCNYKIELGRRPFEVTYQGEVTSVKTTPKINTNYIPITYSNTIESPNDHVLLEKAQEMLYFRNVKTNEVTSKNIATLTYLKSIGKIYQVNELYKKFYNEEILDYSKGGFSNPSSGGLSSSSFK